MRRLLILALLAALPASAQWVQSQASWQQNGVVTYTSGAGSGTAGCVAIWASATSLTCQLGITASGGVITAIGFSGPLTGNVTGNVSGNVTGTASGNITKQASTPGSADTGNANVTGVLRAGTALQAGYNQWTGTVPGTMQAAYGGGNATVNAGNLIATALAQPTITGVTPVLTKVGSITTVAFADLVDGDYFTLDDGSAYVFEYDLAADGVTAGRTAITLAGGEDADAVRDKTITAINGTTINLTATSGGAATVTLTRDGAPGLPAGTNTENVGSAGFAITGMADPTAATTYTYAVTALMGDDPAYHSQASATVSTAVGHATLSSSNLNHVVVGAVSGASGYLWYRTAGGATQGLIGTTTAATVSLDDTGLAATLATPATTNTTGILTGTLAAGTITPAASGGAVALQATTPGTQQTGNANLSGTVIAGAFFSTNFFIDSHENHAFGASALAALTYVAGTCSTGGASGFSMLAIGQGAAQRQTVACESTFVGYHAGQGPIGGGANWWNTGYGRASLGAIRNGSLNACGGEASCTATRDGNQNAGWGADVLATNLDGSYNSFLGSGAATAAANMSQSSGVGYNAGRWRSDDKGIYLGSTAGQYPYVNVLNAKRPFILDSANVGWSYLVGSQLDNWMRLRGDLTAVAPGTPGSEVLPATTFDGTWTRTGAFSIAGGNATINSTSNGTVYATVTGAASTWYQFTVTVSGATYPATVADIPYCKLSITTDFADGATYIPSTNGTYTVAVRSAASAPTVFKINADAQGATNCALTLSSPSLKPVTGGVVNAVGGFVSNAAVGMTKVVTVRDSGGAADCTQTFTGGILTACTCTGCAP